MKHLGIWLFVTLVSMVSARAQEVRLDAFENDNQSKPVITFYKSPGEGRHYVGDLKDLDDREIEWNDKIRSVTLYGPPGTTVLLYDSKNYGKKDDILQITIPEGATSVVVNNLDRDHPAGVSWVKKKNGIAGKVSSLKWQ